MKVDLDMYETGYLCNLIMTRILNAGGTPNIQPRVVELYSKLAVANEELIQQRFDDGKGANK